MRDTHDLEMRAVASFLLDRIKIEPVLGFVLGSGLGHFADEVEDPVIVPTPDVPGYPPSTVPGHAGRIVAGTINDVPVVVVQGRVHFYEGYPIDKVVFPIRLLAALGVKGVVITNASGCISDSLKPGDLMTITDHVNLMGVNPLVGQRWGFDLFPDMSNAYDKQLQAALHEVADDNGIELKDGILGAFSGPNYETAAEVQLLKTVGVDAACMSTVPEVIAAARLRIRVAGVSCITNYATGIAKTPHSHEDVVKVAGEAQVKFRTLLKALVAKFDTIL